LSNPGLTGASRASGSAAGLISGRDGSCGTPTPHLTPDSTLAELPSYDFEVDDGTLGCQVAEEFERRPDLPGVIIRQGTRRVSMVSRQTFFHLISRAFGRELYLRRPIHVLCRAAPFAVLRLPVACRISEAVRRPRNGPP
jgi:hypothetical protein